MSAMKVLKRIAPFAVIIAAALLLLYLPDIAPERYTDLATFFRVERLRQGYSGLSVAAVVDGSVLYVDGFGKDGSGATIGPDTRLCAPSAEKSMAALVAWALVRERRLSLDLHVRDYLPQLVFSGSRGDPTVRSLISHTSGAHDMDRDYQVLALIMEKIVGKPYAMILDERIFRPLGMKSSSAQDAVSHPRGSAPFFSIALPRAAPHSAPGLPPNCVVTTASDIGQYMAFLLGPEKFKRGPLSAKAVSALFDPLEPTAPYGYGLTLGKGVGGRSAWQDGSSDGFSSRIALWPEKRTGIALLVAEGSLLQSFLSLPALTDAARRIVLEGSAPRPFPFGRLYMLLAVVAVVHVFALALQAGGALRWAKAVRDKVEAKGSRGPSIFASLRCWTGILVRAVIAAFCPVVVGLAFGRAVSWPMLFDLEPGLATWCLFACMFGFLRNASRLVWLRRPAGFRRPR